MEINNEETKETKKYSSAKFRMLREPSSKNVCKVFFKECSPNFVEVKLAKTECNIIINKINCKQQNF